MSKLAHTAARLLPICFRSKGKSIRRLFLESLEPRTLLATLAGTVWYDLDASGTRDPGENGQPNWTVYLDANNNALLDGGGGIFTSTDVPRAIPDVTTITSQNVVTGLTSNITDISVTLTLNHTFDSDLTITLISPGGTRVILADGDGGSGDNFTNTTFDDQASIDIFSGNAPFNGVFRPLDSLSVLNGTSGNGTWQLEVADTVGIDFGNLTAWSLNITSGEVFTTTNSTGDYVFSNLPAGLYVVREILQSSWTQTYPPPGAYIFNLGPATTRTGLDFGNFQVNTPPVIGNVPDQSIPEDGFGLVSFNVGDSQSQVNSLSFSATTSDPTLLPPSGIVFSGSGTRRNVTITPASNLFGTATVTLIVTDPGGMTAQDTLQVTVYPINDQPTFTKGANLTVANDAGPQSIANWATAMSVGPANESSQTLSFRVTLLSHAELFSTAPAIAGNGTLTFTPATGAVGTSIISIVAADNGGTANGGVDASVAQTFTITVTAPPPPPPTFQVMAFTPTNSGAVINLSRDVLASALNLYDVVPSVFGPADVTLVGATVGNVRGSLVVDPNLRKLTFVKTSGMLAPDTYTLTLRSAAGGVQDSTGVLLDGDANGTDGGDYVRTFVVNPPAANAVSLSIGNFARGPAQPVNLPANVTTGIPVSFSNGGGITSATFQLRYNPALLTISGATVAPGIPFAVASIDPIVTPGIATVTFNSLVPLPAGTTRFIDLQAAVPTTAPYLSKHVLDITNVSLNLGAIPALDDDAVAVVAYFGDTTGNGSYSGSDSTRIMRHAASLEYGLQNFRLLDPTIVADLTGNGAFSGSDSTRSQQVVVGLPVQEVPTPLPGVSLTMGGPDPKLSIPADLVASQGGLLNIPVNIDSIVDLTGNGLESAELIVHYDATAMEVTSVTVGSLVADHGWTLSSRIDPLAGRVLVSLAGLTPLEGSFQGELVELHATVKPDAPSGSFPINLAATARDLAIRTQLNEGWLTLVPAPTDAPNDLGVDGLLTILPAADALAPRQQRAQFLASLLQPAGAVTLTGASELHTTAHSSVSAASDRALMQLLAELKGSVASGDSATSPLARIRRR